MNYRSILTGLILTALFSVTVTGIALANVPGVAINAPPPPPSPNVAVAGGEGLIKVLVSHRDTGIPATHYVDHVYLFDGTTPIKDWSYTSSNANPNEVFSESLVMPASKDMDLKAIAHCTQHGYSAADVMLTVLPAGTTPQQMVSMNARLAGTQINGIADPAMASATLNAQDAALIKQLQAAEIGKITKEQAETASFFQSSQGQLFLKQFDYTAKKAPANKTAAGMSIYRASRDKGIPQAVWTDSMGNMANGQQVIQMGKAAAQQQPAMQQQSMQPGAMATKPPANRTSMAGAQPMAADKATASPSPMPRTR